MNPWWWSWILAAVGLSGLWLAGNHRAAGWWIGLAVQVLWIAYAVATRQWGFIASALGYAAVNGRNLVKWRHERQTSHADDYGDDLGGWARHTPIQPEEA